MRSRLRLGRPIIRLRFSVSVCTLLTNAKCVTAATAGCWILVVRVRIDFPPTGPCPRALIGGAQPYIVGGPPSHSAIKERWGPRLAVRGSPRRQSPHRYPIPRPDLEKGRCQRREAPPTPATPPRRLDAHAAAEDATAPTPPSPPNVAAGAQMASVNETLTGASTTMAFDGLPPITHLSISL